MEHDKPSGVCGTMNKLRREAILEWICECRKVTLKTYAKSCGLKVSGTKLELAIRIYEVCNKHTYQLHMPPGGTLSIGIALEPCSHDAVVSGGASAFCNDCGTDLV